MKSSVFILAIYAVLVAAQADPAAWAQYDHCPTTPSAGCAYICISAGSDPFCAAADPLTPRVYCNACPTTGDACPAIFDTNCSYLCADGSYPDVRRCAKELPEGAQNVLCAGCAGAPGVAGYGTTATTTVTVTTISVLVSKEVSTVISNHISTVISKEVSTAVSTTTIGTAVGTAVSTVTVAVPGSGTTNSTTASISISIQTSGHDTTVITSTLSVMPGLPTYSVPGNGTNGNSTLTTGLPTPSYISGSSRMGLWDGCFVRFLGLLGFLGLVSGWYV
ncbi:hypothetical protein TWF718_003991 [Orbilia javanica]|uniref:Uncharacterized protein n=1 Tax=Orbilia javanica TaxID=47235 RepID=A0AAN8NAP7_9PEZI